MRLDIIRSNLISRLIFPKIYIYIYINLVRKLIILIIVDMDIESVSNNVFAKTNLAPLILCAFDYNASRHEL